MSSNNFYKDSLLSLHNVVQSSMLSYPKEMFIAGLRDFFSKSEFYSSTIDQFGFPNVTDHTDLPLGADIPVGGIGSTASSNDLLPTRLFIGQIYKTSPVFYPAIIVKSGGSRYIPFSINREQGSVQYEDIIYEDQYGHQTTVHRPAYFITAGAWEGSVIIDVMTRSLIARDEIVQAVAMYFTDISFNSLLDVGIIAKPPNIGGPSESDDRNDKLYKQSITIDIRTEWLRRIPIANTIDSILFTTEFQDISNPDSPVAANLTIHTEINLLDTLLGL